MKSIEVNEAAKSLSEKLTECFVSSGRDENDEECIYVYSQGNVRYRGFSVIFKDQIEVVNDRLQD